MQQSIIIMTLYNHVHLKEFEIFEFGEVYIYI